MTSPSLTMTALLVDDYDRARDWYVAALGFTVECDELLSDASDDAPAKRWVVIRSGGGPAAGCRLLLAKASNDEQRAQVGNQCGGRVWLFFQTDDFERDRARLIAAGAVFEEQPRREPYGTVAVFQDLYGNRCDLIEPVVQPG